MRHESRCAYLCAVSALRGAARRRCAATGVLRFAVGEVGDRIDDHVPIWSIVADPS